MISVIIPTMWVPGFFPETLKTLCEQDVVSEIIIVSNAAVPEGVDLNHDKIKLLQQKGNIGVNPAWNLGAKVSKNNHLVFLNDDFVPSMDFLERALSAEADLVGINHDPKAAKDGVATFRQDGFGCCFYIRKDCYTFIPSPLKIYYGDDVLFYSAVLKNKKIVLLCDVKHNGVLSLTSRKATQHAPLEAIHYATYINAMISSR